ncbi:11255_t:CDS:1 [Funneliformis mosseae]|uniref:11255_t:CDS:1 n=1 Tax=Funneliformis mosseae TaxID=27381 RepID=A0A9N9E7J9_FUNMO|nr:11255_t:CDS:1 [Funneliformis mosseae]
MSTYSQNEKKLLYSKWCEKFDLARHSLLAIFERQDGIQEVKRKGIIIDSEISRGKFQEFSEREPRISVKFRLIDGKIEAYEMPIEHHSIAQGELIYIMRSWSDQLKVMGENDIIVGPRSLYRCDICVRPMNRSLPQTARAVNTSGRIYPTLVVEVGNTESVNSLHGLAAEYFSTYTTIQLYLVIKIFPPRQDNTVALLALLYSRNNPNPTIPIIVKSFGTASLHISTQRYLQSTVNVPVNIITGVGFGAVACDGPGIGDYQVAIPTNLLFNGARVPNDVPDNFYIDLFKLQNAILNW